MPIQGPIPVPPRRVHRRRSFSLWPLFIAIAIVFVPLLVAGTAIGWAATHWQALVEDTPGARARWAVTLAGEGSGEVDRTERAIELLKQHRVDSIVTSGTPVVANTFMSSVILSGEPLSTEERQHFMEARHASNSTLEEACALVPALRALGADTVLLITSNFHSHRAANIFRAVAQGKPVIIPVASNWTRFDNGWKDREAAKAWFMEWCKTLWWTFVDSRKERPLRADAVQIVRYPEAGKVGSSGDDCPVCHCPVCPASKPCPELKSEPKAPAKKESVKKADKPEASQLKEKKDSKSHDKAKASKDKKSDKDDKPAKKPAKEKKH